jgi:hypothetical protein
MEAFPASEPFVTHISAFLSDREGPMCAAEFLSGIKIGVI